MTQFEVYGDWQSIAFKMIRKFYLFVLLCSFLDIACSEDFVLLQSTLTSELDVPKYFREHITTKEEEINYTIQSAEGNVASFIFFTDAHWGRNQKHSPALIKHLVYSTYIRDVIFGGDVITTRYKKANDALVLGQEFQCAFDLPDCNMYFIYGNHDDNSTSQPYELSRHLSEEQVYGYLQSKMAASVYGSYYNFYFDRKESKTRFLCLDTGRFYYPVFRDKTFDTVNFLLEVLGSTPDGWNLVVLSHIWCGLNKDDNGFSYPYIPKFYRLFLNVFDDYNSKKAGIFSYNGQSIHYDFSTVNSRIVCCIGGHNHMDALLYSSEGIPIIINTTDSQQTINGDSAKKRNH